MKRLTLKVVQGIINATSAFLAGEPLDDKEREEVKSADAWAKERRAVIVASRRQTKELPR